MKSYLARPQEVIRQWHLLDADGKILGRLAVTSANPDGSDGTLGQQVPGFLHQIAEVECFPAADLAWVVALRSQDDVDEDQQQGGENYASG